MAPETADEGRVPALPLNQRQSPRPALRTGPRVPALHTGPRVPAQRTGLGRYRRRREPGQPVPPTVVPGFEWLIAALRAGLG